MNILLGFLWFFSVLAWDIITDYNKWKKSEGVKHTKEWWIRVSLLIPSLLFLNIPFHSGAALVSSFLMEGFIFWLLFDGIYNKLRGFDWWFTGSVDPDDSILDTFLRKIGTNLAKFFKIAGAIGFTLGYFCSL